MIDREQLQRDGYTVLRDAIPHDWLDGLRAAFDAREPPSDAWQCRAALAGAIPCLIWSLPCKPFADCPRCFLLLVAMIGERFFSGAGGKVMSPSGARGIEGPAP